MNIKRLVLSALVVGTSSYLTGCSLGSSESECPGIEKGVICKGPREVMELTNNRDDLSALAGKSRNRERRNRLSMTAVIQLKLALQGKSNIHSLLPLKISLWLIQKPKLSQLVSYLSCTIKL